MKRNVTTIFITLSLLFSLAGWRALSLCAASGHTGAGQQVGEPFRIPAIAAGGFHSLALKSDGTVVAWGDNVAGQTTVPAGLSGVTAIAAGRLHSLALKSDGSVVAWGRNDFGQATVPAGLSGVTAIAAGGFHSLALKSDGTVVAWGRNDFGQATVPSGLSGVTAIAAGDFHSLALKSDGTVVAWGLNISGQTTVPAGLSSVTAIAAGLLHSLALKSDGSVVAWGFNGNGQTTVPAGLSSVKAIAAGFEHNLALKSDGSVVAWGRNNFGQTTLPPAGLSGVTAIAPGGGDHGLALKSDGAVVAWGRNDSGQATVPNGLTPGSSRVLAWGHDSFGQLNVPSGLSGVTAIAAGGLHSLALKSGGSVVGWGFNGSGQTTVPTDAQSGVTAIAAGREHSLALKSEGSVVGWGFNGNGQATVPTGLSGVTAIAAGEDHSLALKSDGTVVAWGRNFEGQTTVPSGLSGVTAIAGGGVHSLALKSNGTVVAWGSNFQGQTNVPAALSGVTAIAASLSHSLALKSDGSVVAWGDNSAGQATVPPAAQSGVTAIAAGVNHSLALKSDGSVVSWGSIFGTVPAGVSRVMAITAGFQYSLALSLVNNSPPAITALTVPLPADTQLSSYPIATVNDDLDAADTLTVSATLASGSGVTLGSITTNGSGNVTATVDATCTATTSTFTLRVTDSGGLFAENFLTVTVTPETVPPTITCPANIAKSMDPNQCSAVVTYSAPTVSDNCSGVGAPSCTPASGSTFPKGTTTVSCSATDATANPASCSFTVTVDDTQAPMITCPANVTKSTDPNQCSAVVTYPAPAVSDNCSVGAPSCAPASGSTFPKGTTTVSCSVADASGNQSSCSFTVTVNDTEAPAITCPANVTKSTDPNKCSAVVTYPAPTVSDNCSGAGAPSCTPPSGSTFSKGTATVNCNVTDGAGNHASCSFSVTVNDTQPPSMSCAANITVPAAIGLCSAVVTYSAPVAGDNCPNVGAPTCTPPSGSTFAKGTTTVNCSVRDAVNNQSTCGFTITVVDTQAPTIACPANIITDTVNAGDTTVAVTFAAPQAADNCPGVGVACLPPSGSQFPRGTTTVTCIATDASNNQTSCSFTIKIFDYVIVDNTNGKMLRFISTTGEYDFFDCLKNQSLSGHGVVTITSCKTELRDSGPDPKLPDRNLYAQANPCTKTGTATLTYLNVTHTLSDANLSNNPVKCQ